jgi:hypothetical protein
MKNKRYIKHVMGEFGYNMDSDIILTATDNTGYIYFTDENGVQLKVKYDSAAPINVDPTNWDYEGILTSETYDGVAVGYIADEQYGTLDPANTYINIFAYLTGAVPGFNMNSLIFMINSEYKSSLDIINVEIDDVSYDLVGELNPNMGYVYVIENIMVNPLTVGDHNIKIRYGELILLSDNTEIEISGTSEIIETIDNNNHYIQLFDSGVTYQQIVDDIKSTDESSQIYRFYPDKGVLITDLSLIFADGSYLRVSAENGTQQNYSINTELIWDMSGELPDATINIQYDVNLLVSGGLKPYNFSKGAGDLPSGFYIEENKLYGTTSNPGDYTFDIVCTDFSGESVELPCTLTVIM